MAEKLIKKEFVLSPQNLSIHRANVAKGSNFIFSDKGFIQRKAFYTDNDKLMFVRSRGQSYYGTVIPTDSYVYVEGQRAKVVIVKSWMKLRI